MQAMRIKILAALLVVLGAWSTAEAGVVVGVGVGPYYRPYYGYRHYYGYGYYRPYPVVVGVGVGPVVVGESPVVVQPPPVYATNPPLVNVPNPAPAAPAVAPAAAPAAPVARAAAPDEFEQLLQQFNSPNERVRAEAAMTAGRNKVVKAVAPLTQMLARDDSPKVREAAARGLGLIADRGSLNALQTAAQSDDDREVRHSAQFAAEVIRANLAGR
jgi:hypothetical protein